MSNNKLAWGLLAAVCVMFAWGVIRLYDLRLTAGDIYPVYSSYRADPMGSKVLFDSLSRLPQYSVERNFRPLDDLRQASGTVLWLGEDPFTFMLLGDEDLKQFETIASRGVRLVVVMEPVKRPTSPAQMKVKDSALEKRWGITFAYVRRLSESNQNHTALVMKSGDTASAVIEKPFGKGFVVLADSAYPLSNEALATDRNLPFIERLLGSSRRIIFDEHHLGLAENASIAMLARKYRLTGLVAGLLVLALLFIWRNSSALLPPRETGDRLTQLAEGRDSAAGLQHLLHRHIPPADLIAVCLSEWEKRGHAGRSYSDEKLGIIRQLARTKSNSKPLDVYRRLQSVINHRD